MRIGGQACTNDILGKRLTKGSTTHTWDILNRMEGLNTNLYQYRADGMRTMKTVGTATTRYRHDGQMGIEDSTSEGAVTRYGLGARGIDFMENPAPTGGWVAFPIYDGHGNNVATLARNGLGYNIANRRSFDAWGSVRLGASTGDPSGRYCANLGHKQDDESGLIYMRARYYEPTSGRFLSEDPSRLGGNWLTYCSSCPSSKVDCSGKGEEYEWLTTVFHGPQWFMTGLQNAFDTGGVEGLVEFLNEHFQMAKISFSLGGSAAICSVGQSFTLRLWMHMATILEWLDNGLMWTETELGGLEYLAIDADSIGALVGVAEEAHGAGQ